MKENIVSHFIQWLKYNRAMKSYRKEVAIEREEELDEAVIETTNSMNVLREALIKLYIHKHNNGKIATSRVRH